MDNNAITLGKVRNRHNLNDSSFLGAYLKLLKSESLSEGEKFYLLKVAVRFLDSEDPDIERLGYGIILRYSNQYRDYFPLYDVAIGRGYIPISKFIENKYFESDFGTDNFSDAFLGAYQENFKIKDDNSETYRSKGQMILTEFSKLKDNIAIVAPTSYGKSEMIIKKVESHLDKKVCIIVPSKALLSQTKRILLKNDVIKSHFKKIITHPEMYKATDDYFLAVLTQERLLMLLQKNKTLSVDLVMVDEAHNILGDEGRSHLLAQVLLILQNRDPDFFVNFFTPFLMSVTSLNVFNHEIDIKAKPIKENMKVERFFAYDSTEKKTYLYDQFLNRAFLLEDNSTEDDVEYILKNKASKNIVYLNRPINAEEVALRMSAIENPIIMTPDIQKIVNSIGELIHPNYNLIKCIKGGLVYHHGGIPDVVRLYIEDVFSKYPEFKTIVTTSTLLEGVNIPAEKIFLLTPKKGRGYLSPSQFKNLIGRVCRFKEVFNLGVGDLRLLEPAIHLIKGTYTRDDFALIGFYEESVNSGKKIEDKVENPLLVNSTNEEGRQKVLEYLENMEPGSSGLQNVEKAQTPIGQLCFENNVYDFDILKSEPVLVHNLAVYSELNPEKIKDASGLIAAVSSVFFDDVTLSENSENILRIQKEQKARNFYTMFIAWRVKGSPYPLMINNFIEYWKVREKDQDPLIYVGSKWGDKARDGHRNLFVDISEKTEDERINLAIAKTKEEQEFIDFNILKYVEILNGLELVDPDFFDQVKYGTSDKKIICMLKNGFSMDLARLFRDKYSEQIGFDFEQDLVNFNQALVDTMVANHENEILVFEASSNL